MSTPAPAPFDPHDFPPDLLAAQRKLAGLYAALHAHQATLPWSRKAHPGWPEVKERGREHSGREASPGWPAADAAAYDKLWEDLRQAAEAVRGHGHWSRCRLAGADVVKARQTLKHTEGAGPLRQEDVEQTA
ncbi:hypothetical protein [Streptomyces avermitilis]|uniref:hypothetical protein n=1 Tax=Streptomyces avermitilis TaxID=33903 RepID=UPI003692A29F